MNIVNKNLSLSEFEDYVKSFNFSPLNPNKLVIHHTWKPTIDQWQGQRSIYGLKSYYENTKKWPAGPHLFIAEDGIWLFSPMNQVGIHAGDGNHKSIGIEVVGDYDNKVWEGKTKENVLGAIKALQSRVGDTIMFHRDYSSKSCPGNAITKEWLFEMLKSGELTPEEIEKYEGRTWRT